MALDAGAARSLLACCTIATVFIALIIMNNPIIIVNIIGLETHNEKSARDNQVRWVPSRVTGKLIPLRSGKSKRTKQHRGLAALMMNAQTSRAQREELAQGCACKLIRIAPRLLWDTSESAPSALAAVRDGVADALGVDDRDMSEGGWIEWTYGQEQGPYAVRIELTPKARPTLPAALTRKAAAKRLPRAPRSSRT
jgi:hypothetical protein